MTVLLQIDPRGLLDNMGDLVYLLVFLVFAFLPIVKGIRDSRERQRQKSMGQAGSSADRAPEPVPQSDLEDRVRRYFEEMSRPLEPEPAPRPVERPAPAAPDLRMPESPHLAHAQPIAQHAQPIAPLEHLSIKLRDLEHLKGAPLSSHTRRQSQGRRVMRNTLRAQNRALLRTLRDPSSLKNAVVLREVLGPPKALEQQ